MENTTLMPYRTAPPAIEPIDDKLVPDCDRTELLTLKGKEVSIRAECRKRAERRSNRKVIEGLSISLVGSIWVWSVACVRFHVEGSLVVLSLFVCVVWNIYIFFLAHLYLRDVGEKAELAAHDSELRVLKERGEALESLERLTGKRELAEKLSAELMKFNADLERITLSECAPADLELIAANREDLIARINAFRRTTTPDDGRNERVDKDPENA